MAQNQVFTVHDDRAGRVWGFNQKALQVCIQYAVLTEMGHWRGEVAHCNDTPIQVCLVVIPPDQLNYYEVINGSVCQWNGTARWREKKSVIYPIVKVGCSELTEPLGSIIVEQIVILSLSCCCYDLTVLSPISWHPKPMDHWWLGFVRTIAQGSWYPTPLKLLWLKGWSMYIMWPSAGIALYSNFGLNKFGNFAHC